MLAADHFGVFQPAFLRVHAKRHRCDLEYVAGKGVGGQFDGETTDTCSHARERPAVVRRSIRIGDYDLDICHGCLEDSRSDLPEAIDGAVAELSRSNGQVIGAVGT